MSKIDASLASVLQTNPVQTPTSENSYSVQRGDTLGEIAKQNGVPLETLLAANPQITNPDLIEIGQQINLPAASSMSNQQTTSTETARRQTVEPQTANRRNDRRSKIRFT